ncbi:MAG: histidine phosphatase family protein [Pirellulales bacterium]
MFRVILIRPGSTAFDEQGRIKGAMDMPLSEVGSNQVIKTAEEIADFRVDMVYSAPCESAQQTAAEVAKRCRSKWKVVDTLRNLNHGLWEGKLIDEVRRQQPKVYRQVQEHPESICPPGGETIEDAKTRVKKTLDKWAKKHDAGLVALVIPEPLASVVKELLGSDEIGDLWQSECDQAQWELIESDIEQDTNAADSKSGQLVR